MNEIVKLNILQFSAVYLLLIVVLAIMKKSKINQTKLLIIASFRMTVQLVLAGLILTYIFKNPNPLFTVAYIFVMLVFSIYRVINKNKQLNNKFKLIIGLSMGGSGLLILLFFIGGIVQVNIFNAQYAIPIGGMIIGNSMTGVLLALKKFNESLSEQKIKIETLLNIGATPKQILLPFVNNALETALLPTLNSMLGMGIIALPGMMTGQILSGTLPSTAILYQIAIMISICTAVCLTVFCSLNFGYRTLFNDKNQLKI